MILLVMSCKQKQVSDNAMANMEVKQGFKLSKAQIQLANIKVDTARIKKISEEIIFSGKLVVNENTTEVISSWVAGRIDKLNFKSVGDQINKGDVLYEIYSEDLQSAQKEYLLAIEKQKKLGNGVNDYTQFIDAAKNKLLLYGLTEKQIEQIKNNGSVKNTLSVYSKVTGYIQDLKINEGDYVMTGSTVFKISDNSSLWIEAQVYSDEMNKIKKSTPITYVISAFPNEKLKGVISFVNPELEKDSKINMIRVDINNNNDKYKPGMMAEVMLKTSEKNAISIPVNAVIVDSKGSSVWVQDSTGNFEVRMVTTGIRNSDEVEITSGLKENEKVVISGAYLLNSEYILKIGANPMAGMKM